MMEYLPAESLLMVLPDRLRVNVISFGPFTDSPSVSPSRFSWNSCISFLGTNCINRFFLIKKEANPMIFEQVNIANDEKLAEQNILKIIKNPSSNHRYKALPQ